MGAGALSAATQQWLIYLAAFATWFWVAKPACFDLVRDYRKRRDEFVDALSGKAIALYLDWRLPRRKRVESHGEEQDKQALNAHLDGVVAFRWAGPVVFLVLTGVAVALLSSYVVLAGEGAWLSVVPASALAGGLMWVIFDQLARLRRRDYTTHDVGSHCLRLLFAVPFGLALSAVDGKFSATIAFLLGTFPTTTLFKYGQRLIDRRLKLGDSLAVAGGAHLHLQCLQGVGRPEAERFAEEGFRSVLHLAYTDPFCVAVRTNFDFDFVADVVGQALLWTYAADERLEKIQRLGLRSVVEVSNLKDRLDGDDPAERADAQQLVKDAAVALGISEPAVRKIIYEVVDDPYSKFICALWHDKDGAHPSQVASVKS